MTPFVRQIKCLTKGVIFMDIHEMKDYDLYNDISKRTGGEIYIGVVGPVRTGKSTFIKRFMDVCVLPYMTEGPAKVRAMDELPQSGSGKTIMTSEPKFVPEEAVEEVRKLNKARICTCELEEGVENLFIRIEAYAGEESAVVEIKTKHNHISLIEKNGEVLHQAEDIVTADAGDKSKLNLKDIMEFAETCDPADVDDLIS